MNEWTHFLTRYTGTAWDGEDVLELGPGGTLGTGALILTERAASYQAIDAFALADRIDVGFYDALLNGIPQKERLLKAISDRDKPPFIYIVDPQFRVDQASGARRFSVGAMKSRL